MRTRPLFVVDEGAHQHHLKPMAQLRVVAIGLPGNVRYKAKNVGAARYKTHESKNDPTGHTPNGSYLRRGGTPTGKASFPRWVKYASDAEEMGEAWPGLSSEAGDLANESEIASRVGRYGSGRISPLALGP